MTEDELEPVQSERVDLARQLAAKGVEETGDWLELARLQREAYLEARCFGINDYRKALGAE